MYSERKNRPLRSLLALFERDGYVSSDFYDMKLLEVLETPFGDLDHGGGGGSSIVKVPGDVPPARVYFFGLLV